MGKPPRFEQAGSRQRNPLPSSIFVERLTTMGIHSLPLTVLLLAGVSQAAPLNVATATSATVKEPMAEVVYRQLLREGEIPDLAAACADADLFGINARLEELRDRLMVIAPPPQPFDVVMANARALMVCRAPDSTQTVLARFGPAPGRQRRDWLLLSWQAASAAFDHSRASLALRRLANGNLTALDFEQLTVGYGEDGLPLTRSALDLLVEHEISQGRSSEAVIVLLAGRARGTLGARRLALAAELLQDLGSDQHSTMLESALDQAAADQAWGLAEDLLRLQLKLELKAGGDGSRPRRRLERLATRLDDRYTLWQLIRADSDQQEAATLLEQELRSPLQPGGHAAVGVSPDSLAPSESK